MMISTNLVQKCKNPQSVIITNDKAHKRNQIPLTDDSRQDRISLTLLNMNK